MFQTAPPSMQPPRSNRRPLQRTPGCSLAFWQLRAEGRGRCPAAGRPTSFQLTFGYSETLEGLGRHSIAGGSVAATMWPILAVTHAIAFIAGYALPWHYADFAGTCRVGADTARRIRRGLEDLLGAIHLAARAAQEVTDSSVKLYQRLSAADRASESFQELGIDRLLLRDDALEQEIDAVFVAIHARVRWGHTSVVPALNKPGALEDPESEGRKMLATLIAALGDADVPACKRMIQKLKPLSNWTGFASHRLKNLRAGRFRQH